MNYIAATLKNHWMSMVLVSTILLVASVGLTALQPFEYRSAFSVLLIEKTENGDAFAAAKSAERASLSLAQVLYTSSFYDQVNASGLVDSGLFPADETARRTAWEHQIETRVFPDVGMIKIAAYDTNREKAASLALAVATVLTKNGAEYLGSGENIVLRVVDSPLTSKTPARPNIPVNLAAGLLLGFAGTLAFHLIRDAQRVPQHNFQATHMHTPHNAHQQAQLAQPGMPVITTMFSPEAVARIHGQRNAPPQPPTPTPTQAPEHWEMPDIRRGNGW